MKRSILIIILCLLLPFPTYANKSNLHLIEQAVVDELPANYIKVQSYQLGDTYFARYEKKLPSGRDPFDSYEFRISESSLKLLSLEFFYQKHLPLDEKKLLSEEKLTKLIAPFFKTYDSKQLLVVNPEKLTPYKEGTDKKIELRYAYIVTKNKKQVFIDAYDGTILGLENYEKPMIEIEPESYVLKFWQWLTEKPISKKN